MVKHTGFSGVLNGGIVVPGSASTNTLHVQLGGVAVVCCIHDRIKREVVTVDHVAKLGRELSPPMVYDPKIHHTFLCSCCLNLFVSEQDEPRYCSVCQRRPLHKQMAPLPPPTVQETEE